MAGAPKGNQNAAKGKPWSAAIERAIRKRSKKDTLDALDKLAEKLLVECDCGDMQALKELGDRLDGKPAQAITGADGGPLTVEIIRFGAGKSPA
jgi:hypothetical protein